MLSGAGREPRVPQNRISIGGSQAPGESAGSPAPGTGLGPGGRVGDGRRHGGEAGNTSVNLLISKISRTRGWSAATAMVPPCARACREASMRTRRPMLAM